MKKTFLFVLLMCCFAGVAKAQNIQLHYDLGRAMYNSLEDRPWVTTTVEMFKADKWGSTSSLLIWTIQIRAWLLLIGKSAVN